MKKRIIQAFILGAITVSIFLYSGKVNAANNDTYIKDEYISYIEEVAADYCICPELIEALIEAESSGKANAKNGSCKGLMQVNDKCHIQRMKDLGVTDIYDPYGNILVGIDYLAELFEEYEDVGVVLQKYNGDGIAKLMNKGELSKYADNILKRSQELERVHGKINY